MNIIFNMIYQLFFNKGVVWNGTSNGNLLGVY